MRTRILGILLGLLLTALSAPSLPACQGDCPAKCRHHEAAGQVPEDTMAGAAEAGETALDPICGMVIDRSHAVERAEYEGKTYYFCEEGEKELFLKAPERYLKEE